MSTSVRAAGLTDVGRARDRNEDSLFVGEAVFAVADGLGGHRGGDVASDLALDPIRSLDGSGAKRAASHISEALHRSNRIVFDRQAKEPELKGMGTTLTAVAIHDGIAHLAHVGDSRCYLIRAGTITQLSRDHTLVARMVAEGKLTPAQAESHPQRSVLTRALGAERDLDVQTQNVVLASGDRLLLCSDGLSGVLSPEDLFARAGTGADLEEICRSLIEEANARGGPDNITVVLIDVASSPRDAAAPRPEAEPLSLRERKIPRRVLIWAAVLAIVFGGGTLAARTWANGSYYVGVHEDEVTIYRGLPLEVPVLLPRSVEEPTSLDVNDIDNPALIRSLEDGIRAPSLEAARRIVEEQVEPHVKESPERRLRDGPLADPSESPS